MGASKSLYSNGVGASHACHLRQLPYFHRLMTHDRRDALSFAHRLAGACADALRTGASSTPLVAAFVHGSLTTDDFVAGRSDIDLLVIVDRELVDWQLDRLREVSTAVMSEQSSRVDLRVVTQETATAPTRMPMIELYVGYRPEAAPEVMTRAAEPDLLVEFSVVRQSGMALIGPEPQSVIAEPRAEWIFEHSDRVLAEWEQLTDDARHAELMVLTTCRIWRFAIERRHCSKREAGRWALARGPSLAAIGQALAQRHSGDTSVIDPHEIARLLAVVRADIRDR